MQNRNLSRAVVIDVETDALNTPLEVSLNETSVRLFVRPSDEFEELMNSLNFTRRGRFTWSLGIYNNERKAMRFFARYAKDFIPHSMISIMPYTATYCSNIAEGYRSGNLHSVGMTVLADSRRLTAALADFPNFVAPNLNYSDSYNEERNDIQTNQYHYYRLTRRPNEVNPIDVFYRKYSTIGGVSVEIKNGVLWVRVFVAQDIAEEYKDVIDMRTLKNVSRSRPVPLTPRVAKKTLMSINEKYENFCVDLDEPVQELLDASDDVVCIGYLPNNPASVVLSRGENVGAKTLSQLARYNKGQDYEVTLKTALRLREKNSSTNFLVHPGLSDMVNMTLAQPYQGDARLYEFQKEAIGLHLSTQIGYLNSCEPGCGKGHPLSTKVLTPNGWKKVGDLSTGDEIFGSDGTPTTVTGTYDRGVLDVFKVSFNDGSSVIVDGDHLWSVKKGSGFRGRITDNDTSYAKGLSVNQRRELVTFIENGASKQQAADKFSVSLATAHKLWKKYQQLGNAAFPDVDSSGYKVMETRELAKKLTDGQGKRMWHIPMVAPIQYPYAQSLPIPAYSLGVILGDGSISQNTVNITSADEDIAFLLEKDLKEISEMIVRPKYSETRTTNYALITEPKFAPNPVKNSLKDLGLMGTNSVTKFIPESYLRASLEDRIALFQGLMDTDGYFAKSTNGLQWGSISEVMAGQMRELVESFGGTAMYTQKTKYYKNSKGEKIKGKLYHSLSIAIPNQIIPFRLERKLDGYIPRQRKISRIIASIEPVGQEEVRCISVAAENRLYVTEHHIVTHNTVMQLVAMKARAETIDNYRGLIVVEANARHQWQEEAAVWFPQAQVYALSAGSAIDDLSEAMAKKGPVIIIVSYAQTLLAHEERERRIKFSESLKTMTFNEKMKALQEQPADDLEVGSLLLNTYWNDICADEATVVRNASSKQNSIMWTLRNNSQVAVALTGTPINKSADDLARLVSWTRNDKTMFSGLPLSERYDTASEKGAKELYDIFSTLAFRRDSSVVEGNMPEVQTSVIHLQPTTAEKALANAAERELRRCYLELEAAINGVSADENISEQEIAAAKEELAAARGAWLGGKQLSRLANSDPAALLASESPGAALLMAQGLVEQATLNTPTKRAFYVQEMKKRVLSGQKIVTFTEFSSVAKILVEALVAEGINAKPYMGSNRTVRDQYRQEFQAGNIDVLVCTSAAERGLTLHRAKTIVHYDLPWKAERVVQRTGRGRRIGSQHDVLDVLYMVMSGGIEERIAESIVYGSVAAAMVLDHSRGVDIRRTQSVSALGGLMQDVTSKNLEKFEDFGRIFMKGEKAA